MLLNQVKDQSGDGVKLTQKNELVTGLGIANREYAVGIRAWLWTKIVWVQNLHAKMGVMPKENKNSN